ncbi:MAG: HEAT repeat domain-containing protein [Anaerolineales bacterium]|jgi:HEAT repeat protein
MPISLWWIYNGPPFLMGFALASLLALCLFLAYKPVLAAIEALGETYRKARTSHAGNTSDRLRADIESRAQGAHLAGLWFPLEEIAVPPRFLIPPERIDPLQPPDADAWQIPPYLPDALELAATYGQATLSLKDLLHLRGNAVISGEPGSGRSCALWMLALLQLREERAPSSAGGRGLPVLPLDVPGLDLFNSEKDFLEPIRSALRGITASESSGQILEELLISARSGGLVLTLDSVDEASPDQTARLLRWIRLFTQEFPLARIVAADSPNGSARWIPLGFVRLSLAPWTRLQHQNLAKQWVRRWTTRITAEAQARGPAPDPALVSGWLDPTPDLQTPLQTVLRCWASCRGRPAERASPDGWEAYLESQLSEGDILALSAMARSIVLSGEESFDPKATGRTVGPSRDAESVRRVPLEKTLAHALARRVLIQRGDGRPAFVHCDLAAYLAARSFAQNPPGAELGWPKSQPLLELTLRHLAQRADITVYVQALMGPSRSEGIEPGPGKGLPADLARTFDLLRISRYLPGLDPHSPWKSELFRGLAKVLRNPGKPFPLRARCLCAFLRAEDASISPLFRRMLEEDADPEGRILAVLGLGALHDSASLPALQAQLNSPHLRLSWAAALALGRYSEAAALEALGAALLHGDMNLRRAAAEGLSENAEEGHPLLREAAKDQDLMVRRSAAFGLARVNEPWAEDLLKGMQREDDQWAVRAAAGGALEALQGGNRLPQPPPVLWERPWLIAFAASRKLGVATGEASHGILRRSIKEGNPLERAAAAQAMEQTGFDGFLPELLGALEDSEPLVRDAALEAVWSLTQWPMIR